MELKKDRIQKLLYSENLEQIDFNDLSNLIRQNNDISNYLPDGDFQIDPRDGLKIIFNTARSKRPHDTKKHESKTSDLNSCIICDGNTTSIIDLAQLSEGQTFINQNLFPILFPFEKNATSDKLNCHGMHFLQWTSSIHGNDWNNMPVNDCVIVLKRLAALEKKLLCNNSDFYSSNQDWDNEENTKGFVSIIKNYGRLVGGSLQHAHQQIMLSSVMPLKYKHNLDFEKNNNLKYSKYILLENPEDLTVKDYGEAVLIVPYFMRRPYDMQLVLKNSEKRYLFQLNENELLSCAYGISEAIRAILEIMPKLGREPAYNINIHNGPGAGLYIEFLPYTQEIGGYEHIGLYLCQGRPENSAEILRNLINA